MDPKLEPLADVLVELVVREIRVEMGLPAIPGPSTRTDELLTVPELYRLPELTRLDGAGLYFWFTDEETLLYVGQSKNCWRRWYEHQKDGVPDGIARVTYLPVKHPEQLTLEARYIAALNPPWNRIHRTEAPYT